MVTGPWSYATDGTGRTWFLGTSSNWSFACRAISIAHETVLETPFAADTLLFDGTAYLTAWDNLKANDNSKELSLPSRDHALHLIRSVDFHLGQLFHLFDEETFMQCFHQYHAGSFDTTSSPGFWYAHYLVILAFGKAFVVHKTRPTPPPGAELFVRAQRLLPDMTVLCQIPINATEILCCMAIYLQALDFRNSAYNFIGQAKRIALFEGFHTDFQGRNLNKKDAERCRRIWWTIYVLDHQMTSLMGVPIMLRESDIHARRPTYGNSTEQADILDAHISLSRKMAEIVDTVYGAEGRLDSKFMSSMKDALTGIANLMPRLERVFKSLPNVATGGLSRASAHLHLLHHQCVVLATRPLLLNSMSKMLPELRSSVASKSNPTDSIRSMLRICVQSALQITNVLDGLQKQDLIDTFLSFDLEATFSSAIIIAMFRALLPELVDDKDSGLRIAHRVLDEMCARGNIIAQSRKHALDHFEGVLTCLTSPRVDSSFSGGQDALQNGDMGQFSHVSNSSNTPGYDFNYTNGLPEQLSAAYLHWASDAFSTSDLDWFMNSAASAGDGSGLTDTNTYNN